MPNNDPKNDSAWMPTNNDEWITDRELASWLQVSRDKLQQDRHRKVGAPFVRIGRSVRYSVAAVRAWLVAKTVNPEP